MLRTGSLLAASMVLVGCAAPVAVPPPPPPPVAAVVDVIGVGEGPGAMALSADGRTLYVCLITDTALSVVDTAAGARRGRVPLDDTPNAVAVSAATSRVYVTTSNPARSNVIGDGGFLYVIDPSLDRVGTVVEHEAEARRIALTEDGQDAYLAGPEADAVTVVRQSDGVPTAEIPVEDGPFDLALSPDGTRVYVLNRESDSVSVIDSAGGRVVATIAVGDRPHAVAFAEDGREAYVVHYGDGSLSVIATASSTVTATIPAGDEPVVVRPLPGGRLAVANRGPGTLTIIDTAARSVLAAVPVGGDPEAVVAAPDGRHLYVAVQQEDAVAIVEVAPA